IIIFLKVITTSDDLSDNSLFPPLDGDCKKYTRLLRGIEALDASCFYGRALGFQFAPSVGRVFRFIGVVLATYSLSWEKGYGPLNSLLSTGRFILSPEQRGSRILKVTQEADIDFCKGFWNLSELGNQVPRFFCPNMSVNDEMDIPVDDPIFLETNSGNMIRIPPPSAHTGVRPVRIRILSYSHRYNLKASVGVLDKLPVSPYLLLHCHGGGFVATSSKSHEAYLRSWAKALGCTIVSVDYSLAPENPFPRPTEEALFTYAYLINHAAEFGWTGEKICLTGDSAGGNLVTSLSIRLIQLDVKRRPNGLILIYTPFLFQYLPSPSRVLSFFDPLLHMGVVLRCTDAYARNQSPDMTSANSAFEKMKHKSLQEYVDEVQKAQGNRIFNIEVFFYVSYDSLNLLFCGILGFINFMNVRSFSHSLADTAVTAAGHAIDNLSGWFDDGSPTGNSDKDKLSRVAYLKPRIEALENIKSSYIDKLTRNEVPKDPLISPMYASSAILKQLPPLRFLACHLDPLLDDTICFAKKARDSGAAVLSVDLFDNLPHGFLNFTLVSPECRDGAKLCLNRIRQSFGMNDISFA
uniref:Hormone-sensitive lipase n=1 Tax=Syphacia muris TaxID=451379 RepID=A0A0N5B1D1_9BILA